MRVFIILLSCISTTVACSCFPQSANDVFCRADWVSRVKINFFYNPHNDDTGMYDVIYTVHHICIYKKPANVRKLSSFVFTPSSDGLCGLRMEVGREYLLSANSRISGTRRSDGKLYVYLCGQVTDEDYGGVSEWANVSPTLRGNLTTFLC
ncbi:hypothetical protein RB195_004375 [Necator americanus]